MKIEIKATLTRRPAVWLAAIGLTLCATSWAQTTDTWNGGAGDSEWNSLLNWDQGAPPLDISTNAVIGAGSTVNYNLPMAAGSFGTLTLNGVLYVNTNGFVVGSNGNGAVTVTGSTARLFVTNGGAISLTNGGLTLNTSGGAAIWTGGSLAVQGNLRLGDSSTTGSIGLMTNNGGVLSAASTTVNPANAASSSILVIQGGTNDLGAVSILRSSAGSGGYATLGSEGLIISNGLVRMTSLNIGTAAANSFLSTLFVNGTVTNTGDFNMRQVTSGRGSRFLQTGGLLVSTGNNVHLGITNAGQVIYYSVLGGTNIVPGFLLGDLTNSSGTVSLTNSAKIYIGGGGMTSNLIGTLNVVLNSSGTFGATADWTGSVGIIMNGGTICAGDLDGTPHNITMANRLSSGTGGFTKTGLGKLTLNATNNYTGDTFVNAGTLAMGATGSSPNSSGTYVAAGAVYDVSASSAANGGSGGATNIYNGKTLGGKGSVVGDILASPGSFILPGGNMTTGTLTFSNSLFLTNGATITMDFTTNPASADNDLIEVTGNLILAGTSTLKISAYGVPTNGMAYKVLHYGGTITGDPVAAFQVVGATGTVSHDPVAKIISISFFAGIRAPNSVTWAGNAVTNNWDNNTNSTNWLLFGGLTPFVTGDHVTFDAAGATHPIVNVLASVNPSNTVVAAAANYTFSGPGSLDGVGGLTKTNSGTLTMLLTNNYPGPTTIGGGVLEVSRLSVAGAASGIGNANGDPTNLVFAGGTLRYLGGSTTSSRGALFTNADGIIDVSVNTNTLTMSGVLDGNGGLTKVGDGMLTVNNANTYLGHTKVLAGVLQTTSANGLGSSTNQIDLASGTLILGVGGQPTWYNTFNVISNSALICAGGNNQILNGIFTNTDPNVVLTMSIPTNGYFTFDKNAMTNFSGTFYLGNSQGFLRFNAGGNGTSAQQCNGSPFAGFDLGTNTAALINRNGGGTAYGVYYLGSLAGGPGTMLRGSANSGSSGSTYQIGDRNNDSTFAGTIATGSGGTGATVNIIKTGSGTLTLSGNNSYNGTTTVSGGTLALSGGGSIRYTPTLAMAPGTILDLTAKNDQTLTLNTNQTLSGNMLIKGSVVAGSDGVTGATLSPSATTDTPNGIGSVGVITITSNLVLQSASTLNVDIAPGPTNDNLIVQGNVTLGGNLVINFNDVPVEGQVFKIFNAKSLSGVMNSVGPMYSDLTWDQSRLPIDGTIIATGFPRPIVRGFAVTNQTLTLSAYNGYPNAAFTVLTSTNVGAPLSSWTALQVSGSPATGNFDANGNASASFPITTDEAQRFYLLQYQR